MASMIERLRAERERNRKKGGGGSLYFKLPKDDEAEVRFRILPAKNFYDSDGEVNPEPDLFYKRFGLHWVHGSRIVCPRYTKSERCPVCEAVNELYNSDDPDDQAAAKEYRVKKRHYVNMVAIDDDGNYAESPQIFEFGIKLLDNMLEWCCDDEYYDLSDPDEGYDYRVIKRKKDGFPNYDNSKPVKNPSSIPKETMIDWLDKSVDIHAKIDEEVKTYAEIEAEFSFSTPANTGSSEPVAEDVDQNELLDRINSRLGSDE